MNISSENATSKYCNPTLAPWDRERKRDRGREREDESDEQYELLTEERDLETRRLLEVSIQRKYVRLPCVCVYVCARVCVWMCASRSVKERERETDADNLKSH